MDTDNDNEPQLNLSSTTNSSQSSSNNSSRSNLLANLPILPLSDNNEMNNELPHLPEHAEEPLQLAFEAEGHNGAAVMPQPLPPPPPLASQPAAVEVASQSLSDNSIFLTPLLFNNNSTPPPSSSQSSSSTSPSSSSHNLIQFYHNQQQQDQLHSVHTHHFQHSPSPSIQQHALLPLPSLSLPIVPEQAQQQQHDHAHRQQEETSSATSSSGVQIEQQTLLVQQLEENDNNIIARTIDAVVSNAITVGASNELIADIATTSQQPQQQNLQQQESYAEGRSQSVLSANLSNAQRSEGVIGVLPEVGSSATSQRNRTPPTSLPLLLQQEDEENINADIDQDPGDELNVSASGAQQVEAPKSSSAAHSSYAPPHFTHHPFTHPLQQQQHHHHHHHYYPNFGACSSSGSTNNSPFAFDIPAFSGSDSDVYGGGIAGSSNSGVGGIGLNFLSDLNSSNVANTTNNLIQSVNMLGSSSNSSNPSGSGGPGTTMPGAITGGGGVGGSGISSHHHHHHHHSHQQVTDRLKMLYPNVNEAETPLPRCWSPHDKCLSIGLSQNNLRVHYKGIGNKHNDAASVRTAHPIPPACGLYYFEVKIISKGKNGYMGIGLTAQQFRMNRLPGKGWDKQSYGYHGDDGNSFSSSGNGQSYGPTFTTGDIIGCCVNFVDNTCFYTKNGIDLGIAFRDLPSKLYPTVGLQTPGEEVDANFGQEPFKFDQIEDMMKQMRAQMKTAIYDFPMATDQGDPTTLLHKMVSSYLLHNGYSQTAEAFARSTGQTFQEDMSSIRNRQKILKLVLSGKMGHAIELTLRSYPGLLENNSNLWFMLKCRQFVEMVNGSDIETTPPNQTSVIQSTKSYQNGKSTTANNNAQTMVTTATTTTNSTVINADNHAHQQDMKNASVTDENCSGDAISISNKNNTNIDYMNDVEMEMNVHTTNGNTCKNGTSNFNSSMDADEEMDIDVPSTQKYSHGIERILEFGKELSQMGQQLEKENKMNDEDRQMLEDAFSLIAYSNPWSSPLGWQLCPSKRENVCTSLNSAILESMNYPRRPPLDVCVAHASELLKVMAHSSLGACAFVNIEDIFPQN
ncbi:ran-binding protein 9 isoform X2 [Eurosta solidaginis]|uniref:ran-binding protein 9 isoform X2 n=1 Tax=Eurosta solidaginis TaxID=178769 RepID=UPI003530579F